MWGAQLQEGGHREENRHQDAHFPIVCDCPCPCEGAKLATNYPDMVQRAGSRCERPVRTRDP